MQKLTNSSSSQSNLYTEKRKKVEEKLENTYQGQYGEYKYYTGQVFVFKDGNIANKTLLIRSESPKIHTNRPFLKFKAKPVYAGDSTKELEETISNFQEEFNWYIQTFGDISELNIPHEKYSICKDPMNTENNTVLISTQWINNIEGDIFRIDTNKLYGYISKYPQFKTTLVQLITKFVELSENDIYPDYIGVDNIAIYTKKKIPRIAIIDPHIVWIGRECSEIVKGRLERATKRFKDFLEDPDDLGNIKKLTADGLM